MVDCIADDGGIAHNLATVINTTRLAIRAAQGAKLMSEVGTACAMLLNITPAADKATTACFNFRFINMVP